MTDMEAAFTIMLAILRGLSVPALGYMLVTHVKTEKRLTSQDKDIQTVFKMLKGRDCRCTIRRNGIADIAAIVTKNHTNIAVLAAKLDIDIEH